MSTFCRPDPIAPAAETVRTSPHLEDLDLEPSSKVPASSERQADLEEPRGVARVELGLDGSPLPPGPGVAGRAAGSYRWAFASGAGPLPIPVTISVDTQKECLNMPIEPVESTSSDSVLAAFRGRWGFRAFGNALTYLPLGSPILGARRGLCFGRGFRWIGSR